MAATLHTLLLGKPYDFSMTGRPPVSADQTLERAIAELSGSATTPWGPLVFPQRVYLPRLGFTTTTRAATTCVPMGLGRAELTTETADGIILDRAAGAGGVTVADCLAVVLWDDRQLAVLHGGRECLVPPDGAPGIVEHCLAEREFTPAATSAWIGAGIGACCYGLDRVSPSVPAWAIREPVRGPRADRPQSVDLRAIAADRLRAAGVPAEAITVDARCTSCWDGNRTSPYWSNVRGDRERNLFLAWFA